MLLTGEQEVSIGDSMLTSPSEDNRLRVLVLCTGNSARSIMAEALLNTVGAQLFRAWSAGSKPAGRANPLALEQMNHLALPVTMEIRSKSWDEFTGPDAQEIDLVLTVCGNAAQSCPRFAGDYEHVHWGFSNPAGSSADIEQERIAFQQCFTELNRRVTSLVPLPNNSSKSAVIDAMRAFI